MVVGQDAYYQWRDTYTESPLTCAERPKLKNGRGGGIRTPDPLVPNQMRYQTALRPDSYSLSHPLRLQGHNVRKIPWLPGPKSEWKSPSKTQVSKSMGRMMRVASTMQTPPRKSQLWTVCFRGSSTLPINRA